MNTPLLQYLLEASICLTVFYAYYRWSLRRETFFQLNRAYLMLMPILALIIPAIDIVLPVEPVVNGASEGWIYPMVNNVQQLQSAFTAQMVQPSGGVIFTVGDALLVFYFLGLVIMAFRLSDGLYKLWQQIRKGQREKMDDFTFVHGNSNFPAASFFSYIFWNENDMSDRQRIILEHEKVHIRQWHSLDVLLMELLVMIQWFNPLVYFFRSSLKEMHEYIADQFVSGQFGSLSYAQALLDTKNQPQTGLTNTFAAMLRQRLQMLAQNPSSPRRSWKYALLVPVTVVLMTLFSFNLSDELPGASRLAAANEWAENISEKQLWEYGMEYSRTTYLDWHGVHLSLNQLHQDSVLNQSMQAMNRAYFNRIKDGELTLYKGGERQRIVKYTALFVSPDMEKPLLAEGKRHFKSYANALASLEELSIYLRLETETGELWTSSVAIISTAENYSIKFNPNVVPDIAELRKLQLELLHPTKSYNYSVDIDNYLHIQEKASFEQHIADNATFFLRWGDLQIPLAKSANPNVFSGDLELKMDAIGQYINEPLEIWRDGLPQKINLLEPRIYRREKGGDDWTVDYSEDFQSAYLRSDTPLLNSITEGSTIGFFIETEDIVINMAFVSITDPFDPYLPSIRVPNASDDSPLFAFQVVSVKGQKTILKIDTTNTETAHILKMYQNPERFDIRHIPNFLTNRRLLSDSDFAFNEATEKDEQNTDNQQLIFELPEYTAHLSEPYWLAWGELFANPSSIHYELKEIKQNNKKQLQLHVADKTLDVVSFDFVVQHQEAQAKVLHNITFEDLPIQPILDDLASETSIFFQKIIVKDEQGNSYFFPITFVFHIGKDRPNYTLKIEEVNAGGEAKETTINEQDKHELKWENYTLLQYLAAMAQLGENRIRIPKNGGLNPTLNMSYQSPEMHTRHGNGFLMQELKRRYGFSAKSGYEDLASWRLGLRDETVLETYLVPEELWEKGSPKAIKKGNMEVLEVASTRDLQEFIELRFGIFINLVAFGQEHYYFSLDTSSLENLKSQLEADYGLIFVQGKYPVRMLEVNFIGE